MTEQNSKEYVYYIADEDKINLVNEYTHQNFVNFIKVKNNYSLEDFETLLEKTYNDIVYLGEL